MTASPDCPVNILLVDDRPENLLILEVILGDLGQNLIRASSGEEALRQLLQQDFAVVLLDVQMGSMDGFETAQLIRSRKRSRHTPIIFITAYASDEFPPAKAYTLGAVDYLIKPLAPEVLRAKVKSSFGSSSKPNRSGSSKPAGWPMRRSEPASSAFALSSKIVGTPSRCSTTARPFATPARRPLASSATAPKSSSAAMP